VENSSRQVVLSGTLSAIMGKENSFVVDLSGQLAGEYTTRMNNGANVISCIVTKENLPRPFEIVSCLPQITLSSYTVTYYAPDTENLKYEVVNSSSQVVLSGTISAKIGEENSLNIDLSGQLPGEYITRIDDGAILISCIVTKENPPRPFEIVSCLPQTTISSYTVIYFAPDTENLTYEVVNSSGQVVLSGTSSAIVGEENSLNIDLKDINAGVYTTKLNDGNTTLTCDVRKEDPPRVLEIINCTPQTTTGSYTVIYYSPESLDLTYEVEHSTGQVVLSGSLSPKAGEQNSLSIDLSGFDSGEYTTQITDGAIVASCVVTKEDPPRKLEIISFSPKITTGRFSIDYLSPESESLTYDVEHESGQVVLSGSLNANTSSENSFNVNLDGQLAGNYTTRIDDGISVVECVVTKEDPPRPLEIISCSPKVTVSSYVVTYYSPENINLSYYVEDSAGKVVLSGSIVANVGDANSVRMDLSDRAPGQYTTLLDDGTTVVTCVVTKEEPPRPLEILDCNYNVATKSIIIRYYSPSSGEIEVQVLNSSGEIVRTKREAAVKGDQNKFDIDLSGLSAGDYVTLISDGTSSADCKVNKPLSEPIKELEVIDYTKESLTEIEIDFYSPNDGDVVIEFFDMSGNRALQERFGTNKGENSVVVNISLLVPGNYRVSLYDGETSLSFDVSRLEELQPFSIISTKPEITMDIFSIQCFSPDEEDIFVSVIDKKGKVVYEENFDDVKKGSNNIILYLGDLKAGNYDIKLSKKREKLYCNVSIEKHQIKID